MPRRPYLTSRLGPRTATLAALLATGLTGCGFTAVEVEPYQPTQGTQRTCAALVDELPDVVADAVERDIDPPLPTVAAWGQPPIVLRCGVGLPPEYRPDAVLTEIDGVAWLPIEGEGGMFFAAVDRDPIVEVAIPDDYTPADVLVDLAPVLRTS